MLLQRVTEELHKRNSRSVKTLRITVDSDNGNVNSQVTKNFIAVTTPGIVTLYSWLVSTPVYGQFINNLRSSLSS